MHCRALLVCMLSLETSLDQRGPCLRSTGLPCRLTPCCRHLYMTLTEAVLLFEALLSDRTVVLEKTLENPLDCKEIQPVHPEGDQSWVFMGRTDAEAETPILWPLDPKSWLIRKDPDSGRDWGQEEKGTTEDEIPGWIHQLDGHEFE